MAVTMDQNDDEEENTRSNTTYYGRDRQPRQPFHWFHLVVVTSMFRAAVAVAACQPDQRPRPPLVADAAAPVANDSREGSLHDPVAQFKHCLGDRYRVPWR
jgi:hypothetical protein